MHAPIPIGLMAGVCAALLFTAGAGGAFLTKTILFMLAPLPMFLAGLGWGPVAVVAAGVAGVAMSAVLHGANLAIVFLASIALPVPLLCWLAHLRRPAGDASAGSGMAMEWYPAGRLLAWIAVIAGVLSMLSVLSSGTDIETITASTKQFVERMTQAWTASGGRPPTADEIAWFTTLFVRFMPAATAMSWIFMIVVDFWLAGRILRASGRLIRDWPVLAAIDLPPAMVLGLAASLALSFGTGMVALIAGGFVSAFITAYAMLGLAVLHWITYGKPGRPMALTFAYIACFVLVPYGTIPIAMLGLLESILRLRSRSGAPPPPPAAGPSPGAAA